jgi:hypothetical protein
MENLKNGFLWGLGFGLSITIIIFTTQYLNPHEYEKISKYTPTKIERFEVTSKISRVEGSNFIIAGEYKLMDSPDFEMYKINAVIRNKKGIFIHQCSTEVDVHSVETKNNFTKVIVCHDFSDADSASTVEINLIGYK